MSGLVSAAARRQLAALVVALAAPAGAAQIGAATGPGTVEGALKVLYPGARKTLADVLDKINSGQAVSIACYGDSLTYGQDTTADGQATQINGSAVKRSRFPYPESLDAALGYAGITRVVYNRGYPGDTVEMGLARWAGADATDVAFLMYGTNDGKTRGVSIPDYRKHMARMIEREIGKGAVVVLVAPPMVADTPTNTNIQPYAAVLRELAQEYSVQFVDAVEQLAGVTDVWTDGVHLSSYAYSELGFHLSALFVNRDRARQSICAGSILYPAEAIGRGGALYADARARSGFFLSLAPGQFVTIAGYFDDDVQPVVTSFKTGGAIGKLTVLYAGNGVYRGLGINELNHNPAIAARQALTTNVLRRGYRVLTITNNGADAAYIESVEFAEAGHCTVSRGMLAKCEALSGVFQSDRQSVALGDWWTAADYAHRLKAPYRFTAHVQQSGTGGLAVFKNRQSLDTLNDVLIVYRVGNDLIVREVVAGVVTDTVAGGVGAFAAGKFVGEIDVEMTDAALNVYVDGALKITKAAPANKTGFPGLLSHQTASKIVCDGALIAGYVKAPY